jgi:hypothetical protein
MVTIHHLFEWDFIQIADDKKQAELAIMYIEKHIMLEEVLYLQIWHYLLQVGIM